MKLRNLIRALKDQLPVRRAFRNFFITGNAWGMFSRLSHTKQDGVDKMMYNRRSSAEKAAESMKKKYGKH